MFDEDIINFEVFTILMAQAQKTVKSKEKSNKDETYEIK